ncbi:hypothetical protein [Actinocorallia longicatena]|uniref:Uncharacterized protein n=1 Tax=Actinocorallia longicatena TaxID=111803 RepID=A0ABP6QN12_9ACTN
MTWTELLDDLLKGRHSLTGDTLDADGTLTVTSTNGIEVFHAPLARHHRFDRAEPDLLWTRPILGAGPDGLTYNLNLARRRGLAVLKARQYGQTVVLDLRSGQTATIRPARGDELAELARWDTFVETILSVEESAALDLLDADSWHGRFS